MGMEIIMKARGSLRIHDKVLPILKQQRYRTLSFQAFLSIKFEGFSAKTLWARLK